MQKSELKSKTNTFTRKMHWIMWMWCDMFSCLELREWTDFLSVKLFRNVIFFAAYETSGWLGFAQSDFWLQKESGKRSLLKLIIRESTDSCIYQFRLCEFAQSRAKQTAGHFICRFKCCVGCWCGCRTSIIRQWSTTCQTRRRWFRSSIPHHRFRCDWCEVCITTKWPHRGRGRWRWTRSR